MMINKKILSILSLVFMLLSSLWLSPNPVRAVAQDLSSQIVTSLQANPNSIKDSEIFSISLAFEEVDYIEIIEILILKY